MSLYLGSHFREKERNRWKKFFSSSANAICLISLKSVRKYKCTNKPSLIKIATFYKVALSSALLNDSKYQFVDYKYLKSGL